MVGNFEERHHKHFKDIHKHVYISHYHDGQLSLFGQLRTMTWHIYNAWIWLPKKNTDRFGRGVGKVVYDERNIGDFVTHRRTFSDLLVKQPANYSVVRFLPSSWSLVPSSDGIPVIWGKLRSLVRPQAIIYMALEWLVLWRESWWHYLKESGLVLGAENGTPGHVDFSNAAKRSEREREETKGTEK